MFGSFCGFLRSPFHLHSLLGSRLQTSLLVATVANKYRGPLAFIQTQTLRRTLQKQVVRFNDDNSHDEKLQLTVLYADLVYAECK